MDAELYDLITLQHDSQTKLLAASTEVSKDAIRFQESLFLPFVVEDATAVRVAPLLLLSPPSLPL